MNKAILMGRLTRDPDVHWTQGQDQKCIARYILAVDRRFKQEGGASADFISCVAFGHQAEFAESKAAGQTTQQNPAPMAREDGFMEIPDGLEEELPFS